MKPNRIILIRHAESQGNIDKNHYKNIPDYALNLTPRGIEQAQQAGKAIKHILANESLCVYLSPVSYTHLTLPTIYSV